MQFRQHIRVLSLCTALSASLCDSTDPKCGGDGCGEENADYSE